MSNDDKKRILVSGVKPTGRPHIGNYFGAIKQFVDLQDKYESYVFIADYHALTTVQNANDMRQNSIDIALDYLALGLNPEKAVLFKQSDVPEVCELAWIFNCITTVPYLQRAHAYKDALAKEKEISVGTFDYPLLMAADILIHDADIVPVGQDQKQHVEYARDTAEKFNRIFGDTFKLPEPHILSKVETVKGTDGKKMSKSYNNTIPLFATKEEIEQLVMSIVTDSGSDIPKNVYALHALIKPEDELKELYSIHKGNYKVLKEELIKDMNSLIEPLRNRRDELAKDTVAVQKLLERGALKAQNRTREKMKIVRAKIGVI